MTGPELRAARHELGLSQEKLAQTLGISVTTINRYERGRMAIPTAIDLAVRYLRYE